MDFHRFCSETRCQIILDVPKTPSPPLTEKLDRLMDCTLCVFGGLSMYLCTVYRHIIQMKFLNNEILKLSSKFKILQISSIPVYLSQDHVTDVILKWLICFVFFLVFQVGDIFWTSQADGQKHISHNLMMSWARFYTFFWGGGISAMKPHRSSKLATVCLPQKCCEMIVL